MSTELLKDVPVMSLTVRQSLWQAVIEAFCARRGHVWRPHGLPLRHGHREYCVRCERQRVTLATGRVVECTKGELIAADPDLAEALYEARWGELPRQRIRRGEWPVAD